MKKITISDVAKAANVSVTTVSRYLNGNFAKMSVETQTKIADVIQKLNYHPSASARRLRTHSSKIIGVIVGDISNVFSSLLFSGIYEVLQPQHYSVLLFNANNAAKEERQGINQLLEQQVDGLIIQPSQPTFKHYQFLTKAHMPLVTADRDLSDQPADIGQVMTNNFEASFKFANEMIAANYQQILLISRTTVAISAQVPRIEGFKAAGRQANVPIIELNLAGHPDDWLSDQLNLYAAHSNKRTIVVSLMGPLLFNTLSTLRTLNLTFPDQIGLASFDDWNWSQFVGDGIDLMQQNPNEIGRQAAKVLLATINGEGTPKDGATLIPATRVRGGSF